jgi:hypothetical protein
MPPGEELRAAAARQLRWQAGYCAQLGSPLYAALLESAARDAEAGGPAVALLAPWAGAPLGDVPAVRLLGAAHRLVLEGEAPELARFYPSAGGDPRAGDPWPALRAVLEEHGEHVAELMRRPVQTNEVGRCAALLGGFLLVARETGLPLRLLELGSSAGLNLRWDHYRYEQGEDGWGDPASAVRFRDPFTDGPRPPFDVAASVCERRGCDARPVDPLSAGGRLTLESYVWPDMTTRLTQLRGALEIAPRVPATVEQADLVAWLEATPLTVPGAATVVFHSIVMQYLAPPQRERVAAVLAGAGAQATRNGSLAWLSLEPGGEQASGRLAPESRSDQPLVRLRTWPGGEQRVLATAGFHGAPVGWSAQWS